MSAEKQLTLYILQAEGCKFGEIDSLRLTYGGDKFPIYGTTVDLPKGMLDDFRKQIDGNNILEPGYTIFYRPIDHRIYDGE